MNLFFFKRLFRSIWIRPAVYALMALAAVGLVRPIAALVPEAWGGWVERATVVQTLEILASSLLAVAIFSLATMFAAFQAAAEAATPRARTLVTQDRTAQTAVSTFIGAFVFSLGALIALGAGALRDGELPVVFSMTLLLVALVIITLIRWIKRLSGFGGVEAAIQAIETAASEAFRMDARRPCLGGAPADRPPRGARAVAADEVGYVQSVDTPRLADLIARHEVKIHVEARPGRFVGPGRPLAHIVGGEGCDDAVRSAFLIGAQRTFEEDPRFGLVAISEIASRAMSPAVNDPGTAIFALSAQARILARWSADRAELETEDAIDGLTAPPISAEAAFEDAFLAIGRDGAAFVEVGERLQAVLAMLAECDPDAYRDAAKAQSGDALARAKAALGQASDLKKIRNSAR